MEGVKESKGQLVVMVLPEDRILGHILQGIVHPAHVPLHTKTQPSHIGRSGDHRPCGRLLSNRLHIRIVLIDLLVEASQKRDGFQVFPAAESIGDPFPFLA